MCILLSIYLSRLCVFFYYYYYYKKFRWIDTRGLTKVKHTSNSISAYRSIYGSPTNKVLMSAMGIKLTILWIMSQFFANWGNFYWLIMHSFDEICEFMEEIQNIMILQISVHVRLILNVHDHFYMNIILNNIIL